jgi:hypothetical protein
LVNAAQRLKIKSQGYWFESNRGSKASALSSEDARRGRRSLRVHEPSCTLYSSNTDEAGAVGRPSLPPGTHGKVLFIDMPNGQVQARAKFRDYDGQVRLVAKVRRSRAAAERALKAELTSRQAPGGASALRSGTRVADLADAWLNTDHGWSTGTARTCGSVVNRQVKPALGKLCIREVTPGVVSRALSAIAKNSGPGAAKTARA